MSEHACPDCKPGAPCETGQRLIEACKVAHMTARADADWAEHTKAVAAWWRHVTGERGE